jgi:small-conductance mechanosensitive channel
MTFESFDKYILPLAIFGGSLLLGLLFDLVLYKYLKRLSIKTKWEGDDVIIEAIHRKFIILFTIGGLYFSVLNIHMNPIIQGEILNLFLILFILAVTRILAKITVGLMNLYLKKKEGVFPSASIFTNVVKVLIYILGILVILQSLGISITPILTALGVGGLAVALALQETLSNLFSGLQILASKQIKPGDYVKMSSGEEGTISDITWKNTTITQPSNNLIIIPNSKLSSSIITNYYLPDKEISFSVPICVSYNNNLESVEQITIEVAREVVKNVEGAIATVDPVIRFHTFTDFNIKFNVIFRAKEYTNQFILIHEFLKKLHARYLEKGVQISVPVKITS